jgi:hypothetical protein
MSRSDRPRIPHRDRTAPATPRGKEGVRREGEVGEGREREGREGSERGELGRGGFGEIEKKEGNN